MAYPGNLNGGPVVELGGNPAQNYTGPGTYVVRSGTFGSANLGGLLARCPQTCRACVGCEQSQHNVKVYGMVHRLERLLCILSSTLTWHPNAQ